MAIAKISLAGGNLARYNVAMKPQEIKALRHRLKMTGREFADKIGVTVNTVFRWEMGVRKPDRLARAIIMSAASTGVFPAWAKEIA